MFYAILFAVVLPEVVFSTINKQLIVDASEEFEETHVFLNERGALVDQTVRRIDKESLLIVNVPAHHDVLEMQAVFDENSKWMMEVIPQTESCNIMVKPPHMMGKEKEMFELAKNDNSTKVQPNEVLKKNEDKSKDGNTLEVEYNSYVGYNISHAYIPEKFKKYCPSHFTAYTTRSVLKGENSTLYPTANGVADMYDFVPGVSTNPTGRQKRDILECEWANGRKIKGGCSMVHAAKCKYGSCTESILRCSRTTQRTCWYINCGCPKIAGGDGFTNCYIHLENTNQYCTACCGNQDCGESMPRCM